MSKCCSTQKTIQAQRKRRRTNNWRVCGTIPFSFPAPGSRASAQTREKRSLFLLLLCYYLVCTNSSRLRPPQEKSSEYSRQKAEGPINVPVPVSTFVPSQSKLHTLSTGCLLPPKRHLAHGSLHSVLVPAAYRKRNPTMYCWVGCVPKKSPSAPWLPAPLGRMKHWLTYCGSFLGLGLLLLPPPSLRC